VAAHGLAKVAGIADLHGLWAPALDARAAGGAQHPGGTRGRA